MGYKVPTGILEDFKKNLEANNKLLKNLPASPKNAKQIKANDKQIKLLEDEFYIGKN